MARFVCVIFRCIARARGIAALSPGALETLEGIAEARASVDLMGGLIPSLIEGGGRVGAYFTDAFWYDVGSTEKYEKIDNGLVDRLFTFEE